jgi:hypothetical protein
MAVEKVDTVSVGKQVEKPYGKAGLGSKIRLMGLYYRHHHKLDKFISLKVAFTIHTLPP